MARVPTTVVTGFLGGGGCGVEGCEDEDILALASGCICCTVADDFLPTLQKLIDRPNPPEHILVGTSGLAPPKPPASTICSPSP